MAETTREKLLNDLRAQIKAAPAGSIAGIQGIRLLAELEGMRTPPAPSAPRTHLPQTKLAHVEKLLRAAQAQRLAAEAKGSFVAASRYLALEHELLQEYDQLRQAALAEEESKRDEGRIVSEFASDWSRLPKRVQDRIRTIIDASDG